MFICVQSVGGEHTLRYAVAIVADMVRPGSAGAIGAYKRHKFRLAVVVN